MKKEYLEKINKALEDIKNYNLGYDDAYNLCREIADDIGEYSVMDDFVDEEMAEEIAKKRLKECGLYGLCCCLSDINYFSDNFYYLDSCANLRNVKMDDFADVLSELKTTVEEMDEEEKEEE